MSSARVALALCVVAFAGCGDGGDDGPTPPPTAGRDAPGAPEILRAPKETGEILVKGDASPATHGPFRFDGRYRVRFAQYAPEDPSIDFAKQTAFVAALGPVRPGPNARGQRLFRAAARSGSTTIDVRGSYVVDVSFGDFPYVIRFTPDL